MLKTKLEVLLDKMHLILDDSESELDDVDKRLLLKYNDQIKGLLGKGVKETQNKITTESATKKLEDETPEPETTVVPEMENEGRGSIESQDTMQTKSGNETEAKEDEDGIKKRTPLVQPVDDADEQGNGQSLSFLDDEGEQETGEKKSDAEIENHQEKKDQYQEVYENLEALRKQRATNQKLVEENDEDEEEDDSSLNDSFRQSEADLVDHLKEKPIKSLQAEIDLNDKFWFINELFDGDAATFNRLLRELDLMHSFEDAKEKINEMGEIKYDWDDNNRAVDKFYRVVRRRYL